VLAGGIRKISRHQETFCPRGYPSTPRRRAGGPGGAGPMTRAMLLLNVVESAERSLAGQTAAAAV
jgi:hypothetical protein